MSFMGLDLGLLAYGAPLDIAFNPFLYADPPVVLLDSLKCFVSSWMSSCGCIVCFAYYFPLQLLYIWDYELFCWGMEDAYLR